MKTRKYILVPVAVDVDDAGKLKESYPPEHDYIESMLRGVNKLHDSEQAAEEELFDALEAFVDNDV